MQKQPSNFRRDIIINNNLLEYINDINTSHRNKEITIKYANGISFKELSKEYSVTAVRIGQIVRSCCNKCVWFKKRTPHRT